jgi:hypothetical protein
VADTIALGSATIKPKPVGFTVTVLGNYPVPIPVPIKESFGTFQTVKPAVEVYCEKQQLRDIDIQFYRQPMVKGKVVFQQMGSGEFSLWPFGSLNERLHEALCQ